MTDARSGHIDICDFVNRLVHHIIDETSGVRSYMVKQDSFPVPDIGCIKQRDDVKMLYGW